MAEAGLSTLLLEAGGPSYGVTGGDLASRRPVWLAGTQLSRVDVPGLYKSIFGNPGGLICESDMVHAYGGCTIGGSSAINAGLFFEPPASDFDLYFPKGWKSIDMDAAIERLYKTIPSTSVPSQDGLLYLQSGFDAARKWLVTGLGFKERNINHHVDVKTEVFGHPAFDYSNGQRGGPVTTYLQNALKKKKFHLQSGTRVLRVEQKAGTATGVTALINGIAGTKFIKLTGTGRVILSAGAIMSPGLLMMSGIGDPAVLSRITGAGKLSLAKKDWVNHTAVGTRLFDNPNTFIELQGDSISSYVYSYDSPIPHDRDLYLQHRSGPYTFASQTSVFWDTFKRADGGIVSLQGTIDSSGFGEFTANKTITMNIYGTSGLKSRGKVILDNNFIPGPDDNVYYSDPADADAISSLIFKIFQGLPAAGLKSLNLAQSSTKAQISQYITTFSTYARGQVNHWSSSCEIGKCVDVNTQVIGTKNIHVVDASILAPLTVNPQFGVMAAAERASDLILKLMKK
jgi:cellobiose dehydrogenase (acceptor)